MYVSCVTHVIKKRIRVAKNFNDLLSLTLGVMSKLKKGPMLQYINQVNIKFSPFSPSAKTARQVNKLLYRLHWSLLYLNWIYFLVHRIFLSRIMTNNGRKANPNAKINTVLLPNPNDKSNINITFRTYENVQFQE